MLTVTSLYVQPQPPTCDEDDDDDDECRCVCCQMAESVAYDVVLSLHGALINTSKRQSNAQCPSKHDTILECQILCKLGMTRVTVKNLND